MRMPDVVRLGVLGVLYIVTAKAGLSLDAVHGFAAAVWPPTGIALVALVLYGTHLWPGIAGGAFLVNWLAGAPVLVACGMALGNTLEALIATVLLTRVVGFRPSLDRLRDVLGVIVLVAGLSTLVSATLGVTSGWLGGVIPAATYGKAWRTWWLGDALGTLVVAPLLFVWSGRGARSPYGTAEALVLLVAVGTLSLAVFGNLLDPTLIHFPYLVFPPLIWAAVRLGPQGAVTATALVAASAIWGTLQGCGPFVGPTLHEGLFLLQAFMSVVAGTMLVLAAVVAERQQTEATHAQLAAIVDSSEEAIIGKTLEGRITSWNRGAEQLYGYTAAEVLGQPIALLIPPDRRDEHPEMLARLQRGERIAHYETQHMAKDGTRYDVALTIAPIRDGAGQLRGASTIARDITARTQAAAELERRRHETVLLAAIAQGLSASLDLDTVLQRVVTGAQELCGSERAFLSLRVPGTEALVGRYEVGAPRAGYAGLRLAPGQGLGGQVLRTGQPWRTADYSADARFSKVSLVGVRMEGHLAMLAVPILMGGQVEGVLYVSNPVTQPFTDRDEDIVVRLAAHAAIAIQNAQLYQQAQAELTARQQAEATLRQQAALLDLAHDAIMVFDMAQQLVFWNHAAEVRYGWTKEEALGHSPHTLLQTVFPQPLAAIQDALLRHGRWEGELVHMTRAGTRLVVASRWAVQRDATGQPVAILEINNDITQRKQVEETLQQQLEWLDTTLSSIGDAVIATNVEGTITFLNPVAEKLMGWPAQEALGQPIETVLRLCHAQTHQAIEGLVPRVLHTGEIVELAAETRLVTRHGQTLPVTHSAAPIRGLRGTQQGVVMVLRDISAYTHLEEQLRQAQKLEAIGTLAGGIAHDFNNILAAILGFTELAIYDVPQVSATWHNLQQVLTAGKRAKDLVQQILAFSRKTLTARTPITLHMLVTEALVLLRASLPSTIPIRTHLAEDAGAVLADATQLHQVLLNLCANAAYAMRMTGGVLEVQLEAVEVEAPLAVIQATLQPGSYVRLMVRDTGQGMAPDVVERIFEPYFTTKPPGEGSGIGLAVVHGIITHHEGGIAVTSAPGHGTTVTVYLPRLAEAEAAPDRPPQAEELLPGGTERLLFVDDEPAMAALGHEVLTRLGYQVVVCRSSQEALDTFRATSPPFDLVITDQTMPELTGDALAQALRQLRPDLPVVLCTGFSHTLEADRARASGVNALVMKPWDVQNLAQTIRRVLDQRVSERCAPGR
jgi:PAS domain S-box-containing protein